MSIFLCLPFKVDAILEMQVSLSNDSEGNVVIHK